MLDKFLILKLNKTKYLNLIRFSKLCTSTKLNLKNVTFFGTDLFSLQILNGLNKLFKKKLINNLNVVTCNNENQQHSGIKTIKKNYVIDYCNENKINYHVWQFLKQDFNYEKVLADNDLAVVASFGYLLPSRLISLYKNGVINVHPSLLPRWRGASPIQYSILTNDQITGTTLMKILPKHFDIGPVIMQRKIETPKNVTTLKLLDVLAVLGVNMLNEFFSNPDVYLNKVQMQPDNNVTYAHKITSEMYFIDWANQTCSEIGSLYRALNEILPLKTELSGKAVKLTDMVELNSLKNENKVRLLDMTKPPGYVTFISKDKVLAIKCKDGYVGFKNIIIRSKLTAADFNNGFIQGKSDLVFESRTNSILDNIYKPKIK